MWSGTSFAAPVLAGELAEAVLREREGSGPGEVDWQARAKARRRAAWRAINEVTGLPLPD